MHIVKIEYNNHNTIYKNMKSAMINVVSYKKQDSRTIIKMSSAYLLSQACVYPNSMPFYLL